ncbi:DUF1816 domain-containing protein [Lyngbya sp. PCC 8106]|uniref:DUF1816 domain-containing protein n=1 Tax=Lyngbya sp. (strain PCC 8106) TaxID=313612 RepID=UPI0000EA908C|nr:DUF1816 domain-containing protein [Lyngbya sp. PCC 8106]EAW35232.1 hypothetical protein L8106_15884 [Lyngbya sp. PCC 8106]
MTTFEHPQTMAQKIKYYAEKLFGTFLEEKIETKQQKKTTLVFDQSLLDQSVEDQSVEDQLEFEKDLFTEEAEEIFTSYLEKMGLACWIEVVTESPKCIYYFGPFASGIEAQHSVEGYLEDLQSENTKIFELNIKRGIPKSMTILPEEMRNFCVDSEFSTFIPSYLSP